MDDYTSWTTAATLLTILLVAAAFYFLFSSSPLERVDTTILLMGPSNSGKSLLFSKLYLNALSKNDAEICMEKKIETVMSIECSSCIVPLDHESVYNSKKALLVDLPGHSRLSWKLNDWTSKASSILFLLDSQCSPALLKTAAESLYSILTNQVLVKRKVSVKLVCTKTDLDAAKSVQEVCRLLEGEMERVRASKANDMLDQQEEEGHEYLGYEGEAFSFDHVVNPISWARISLTKDDVDLGTLVNGIVD